MSIIRQHSNNIQNQFICIDELLQMLSTLEDVTMQEAALWLIAHEYVLRRTKRLVLVNAHLLAEYEHNENNSYNCPIETIRLIGNGEDCNLFSQEIGFARKRLLIDLKNEGFALSNELISKSYPYVSIDSKDYDDNFYKNQLIDYLEEKSNNNELTQAIITKTDIPFIHFLDSSNPCYVAMFALILRIHQELNYVGKYSDKSIKKDKVLACLEEYGDQYGYNATDTHATTLANIMPNRKDTDQKAQDFMKRILAEKV